MNYFLKPVLTSLIAMPLFGCASQQYRYEPVENQAAQSELQGSSQIKANQTEAIYQVGQSGAEGIVRVISRGIVNVNPSQGKAAFAALHLRMVMSNRSEQRLWTINAEEQRVSLPDKGELKPALANSDATTLPKLEIRPGEMRTFDLYFPLPPAQTAKNLPEFDFHWKFEAGLKTIRASTSFDRVALIEAPIDVYAYDDGTYANVTSRDPGWGPYWWGGL